MIPELPHAQLDWDDQGRPRSRVFDDVYFSSESALAVKAPGVRAARGQVVGDSFNRCQVGRLMIKA